MSRLLVREMALAYRRTFGQTSLQKLLAEHGIDDLVSALEQQDKYAELITAFRGKLSVDAIAVAQARAEAPPSNGGDDIADDTAHTPKTLDDLVKPAFDKWNAKKAKRANA